MYEHSITDPASLAVVERHPRLTVEAAGRPVGCARSGRRRRQLRLRQDWMRPASAGRPFGGAAA